MQHSKPAPHAKNITPPHIFKGFKRLSQVVIRGLLAILMLGAGLAHAQNVGINQSGPDRRLDVLDATNPQLRLTYTDGSVYTDFQTTSGGMLYLNPSGKNVGIGINPPLWPLHVTGASTAQTAHYTTVLFENTASSVTINLNKYGLRVTSTGAWSASGNQNFGMYSAVSGGTSDFAVYGTATGTGTNYGGYFDASGGTGNIGAVGVTSSNGGTGIQGTNSSTGAGNQTGVYGTKTGNASGAGYAVRGAASGTGANNYGVYSDASGGTINTGVYGLTSGALGNNFGADFSNTSTLAASTQYGLRATKSGNLGAGTGTGYAIYGSATGTGATNYAGYFDASGATANTGVRAIGANYGVDASTSTSGGIGVRGINSSTGASAQYGVYGSKTGATGTGAGYGVYGTATASAFLNYGVYGTATGASLVNYGVAGDVVASGGTTAVGGAFTASGATTNNFGVSGSTDANGGVGAYAENYSTGTGSQYGLKALKNGHTATGTGYAAYAAATGSGANNYGVYGTASGATINTGVYGIGSEYGVYGTTATDGGTGSYGLNSSTGTGNQYGLYGSKTGATGTGTGHGVYGTATGTGATNYGGYFASTGATGNTGVYATATGSGTNNYGGYFSATDATANTGVYAEGTEKGVYGISMADNSIAIDGFNTAEINTIGVKGTSISTDLVGKGVYGVGPNGVYGEANQLGGIGVVGINSLSGGSGSEYGIVGSKTGNAHFLSLHGGVAGTATGTGLINCGGIFSASGATSNFSIYGATGMMYNAGKVYFGPSGPAPTAYLHLSAGTASANTAPFKLTSGTNLTTPEAGAIEYDGTNFYATPGSATRKILMSGFTATAALNFPSVAATGGKQDLTITVTGAAVGDNCYCSPNTTLEVDVTYNCWVSAANTVTIRVTNPTGGALDPASRTWRATVIQY